MTLFIITLVFPVAKEIQFLSDLFDKVYQGDIHSTNDQLKEALRLNIVMRPFSKKNWWTDSWWTTEEIVSHNLSDFVDKKVKHRKFKFFLSVSLSTIERFTFRKNIIRSSFFRTIK